MEKWATTALPSRIVQRCTSGMSNGVPFATVVPFVRPTWITSPSAMNIASVVTADVIAPVSAPANARESGMADMAAAPRSAASCVITHSSSTNDANVSRSRAAMAS